MNLLSFRSRDVLLAVAALAAVGIAAYLLLIRPRLPALDELPGPGSPRYEKYVADFELGAAALDADVPDVAQKNLTAAIELIPQEPAAWADRGLLFLRYERLDEAAHDLDEANRLAPDNPKIQKLLGLLDQRRGQFGAAAAHFRQAVERDPRDVESLYHLAQVVDREHEQGSEANYQQLLEQILAVQPDNLFVLQDRLRVALRRSDLPAARDTVEQLKQLSAHWSPKTQSALANLDRALVDAAGKASITLVLQFSNLLRAEPGFARSAAAVSPTDVLAGSSSSLQTFLRLALPQSTPAAPDTKLAFSVKPWSEALVGSWEVAQPVWLTKGSRPVVFVASAEELREVGAGIVLPSVPVLADGFLALDWNNDFRMDLLLAGPEGLRFYEQQEDGDFQDVTARTGLADDVRHANFFGAWAADVDLDGDLDIVCARHTGPPLLLRNNFDGTFLAQPIFAEVDGGRAFAWADLDRDGVPDAAWLDARGSLHVFANERSGNFQVWPARPPSEPLLALTVADANHDGQLDLVVLDQTGALRRISDRNKRSAWDVSELGPAGQLPPAMQLGAARLLAADLDNNGLADLVVSGPQVSRVWLGDGAAPEFAALAADLPARVFAAADLDGDGRLDLIGLDRNGQAVRLVSAGQQDYHWQAVRPVAKGVEGDNRINSYAVGGEAEIRAGTFFAKQTIAAPVVHFGLGSQPRADILRLEWPNGVSQYEFNLAADKTVVAEQRLKGSCPFLFSWNGERFVFVADFMWSTPLGMYINGQDTDNFLQTTDWLKIRGDQLVPRDGAYEVRVNANLWETHYFDHLSLLVVDHPINCEMFVDERFFLEPTVPAIHLTGKPQPVCGAWDHRGKDVTQIVSAVDGVYLDRCGRGPYQGLTSDHWVEIDLSADVAGTGPLWLLARGWVHPTDSSINFALAQGRHDRPQALSVEVPDGQGGWKVARDKLGFPAGKNKTMLIRLDDLAETGVPTRLRLRTNMEIFWDALLCARGRDETIASQHRLSPVSAELRYRGILEMTQANVSSPEVPNYDRLVARRQYWRDLIGFHTRHGDVEELLAQVDDRYAILCAGDEIVLRFAAPADPAAGWTRDFVWICDGWVKDGDFNTRFGKTVMPLPAHDLKSYHTPPAALEDDPVFQRHPQDWQTYHTRFVTPDVYEQGLRGPSAAGRAP